MDIALLEAAKSGIDSYEKLVRYMDEQISEVVLGETGTTNQSGDSGSRARDEIGNEVRLETAKYDADALCEVLNETLVKWIIDFNMPGAPYPRLWRDFSEPEDLVQKAQRDKSLTETGVKLRKKYYIREYNLQEDDFDLVEPKPKDRATDQRPGNPAEFATAESSDVAKLAEAFAEKSGKPMELLLKPLKKLVEESQSYDEMLDKLLDVYEDLDPTALGVIMENAMVLSELKGRSEVVDGE
jgi:phage gp29-like protein